MKINQNFPEKKDSHQVHFEEPEIIKNDELKMIKGDDDPPKDPPPPPPPDDMDPPDPNEPG